MEKLLVQSEKYVLLILDTERKTMILEKLHELAILAYNGNLPEAEENFRFHDEVFVETERNNPNYIVTPHAMKISWLVEKLYSLRNNIVGVSPERYSFLVPIFSAVRDALEKNPKTDEKELGILIFDLGCKLIGEAIGNAACNGVNKPAGLHLYFGYENFPWCNAGDEEGLGWTGVDDVYTLILGPAVLRGYKAIRYDAVCDTPMVPEDDYYADFEPESGAEIHGALYAVSDEGLLFSAYPFFEYNSIALPVCWKDKQCTAYLAKVKKDGNGKAVFSEQGKKFFGTENIDFKD